MSSIHFNLQDLLDGDAVQLQSLFDTAALTLPPAQGPGVCEDLAQVIPATLAAANPAEPLSKQLPSLLKTNNLVLAPALTLRLMLADKIFHTLFGENHIDPLLRHELERLALPVILPLAQDDSFYSDKQHPLRQLLSELSERGCTWYPRDAKPQQQFLEKYQQLIDAACSAVDDAALRNSIEQFRQWATGEDKRAHMLETRLCETEVAHLRLMAAECQVLDSLNHSLAGRQLPLAIVEQLPVLKSTLQHCVINEGTQASFWKAWQRCLPMLGGVFAVGDDVDEQLLYRDIPQLLSELERNLHQQRDTGEPYQEFVDTLAQHLMQAIQKKPMECSVVSPFPYPDGYTDNRTRVTSAVLQQAQAIEPGDWILLNNEDGQLVRCKLALKLPDVDQYLFVDRSGRKVTAKSLKDFSLCLSTGVARKLNMISVDEVITSALKYLIALGDKHAEQYRQETARQQAQEAAEKRAAAEKALAEARALAAEKQQRELAEKAAAVQRQAHEKAARAAELLARENIALELVSSLNVGAWVEIREPDKAALRCKLSVIISSTGKYIFVDQFGRKAAELHRQQLLDGISAQQIEVISKGDKFEDQLVKVIRGLRKDIS